MSVDNEKLPTETDQSSNGHSRDHDGLKPAGETVADREATKEKDALASDKRELKEADCEDQLGFAFPTWYKWWILTVIFLVQTSMNFNTSLYSNGLAGISEHFNVSEQAARVGAAIFLVTYAFGCELWAPWSEEFGRKPVLQASLFLVNIWCLPVALAPNFGSLLVGRALGGLSSAGGSVTLGMIADMFDSDNQQYAVAYIVFSSVGGSILGPIIGGFVEQYLEWQWAIWIQLIFGGFVQILHLLTVPETRTTIMLDNIAKKRRKTGVDPDVYGPNEVESFWDRFTFRELMHTWLRPFRMFLTEPIVLTLSLLSGFSDALIFMQIQSFALVYKQWDFTSVQIGLAFIPIGIGYVIAWLCFIPAIRRNKAAREKNPEDEHAQYESRLWWLLWTAPCLPIGLIIFAWTSSGPPLHWIGTMFGSAIIGIANYAIYASTIDYLMGCYGEYAASATGGNGWSRDFLAGVLTVPATPFYSNIGAEKGRNLEYASTILFCISVVLVMAVYVIYWKGPVLRKRSPFAQTLASSATGPTGRRLSIVRTRSSVAKHKQRPGPGSRRSSYAYSHRAAERGTSRHASKNASRNVSRANSFDAPTSHPTTSGVITPTGQGQSTGHPSRPVALGNRFGPGSRRSSFYSSKHAASRSASRANSRASSRRNSLEDPGSSASGHGHPRTDRLAHLSTIPSVQPQ